MPMHTHENLDLAVHYTNRFSLNLEEKKPPFSNYLYLSLSKNQRTLKTKGRRALKQGEWVSFSCIKISSPHTLHSSTQTKEKERKHKRKMKESVDESPFSFLFRFSCMLSFLLFWLFHFFIFIKPYHVSNDDRLLLKIKIKKDKLMK